MLGLALGAWGAGKWIVGWTEKTYLSAVYFYALAELLIGIGAFTVPRLFSEGKAWLLLLGGMYSFDYFLLSAGIIVFSILPWCILMGATFPLMMAFVREVERDDTTSFSYLYLANVMGAMCGVSVTALILVELLGLRKTLFVGALSNFTIAILSVLLGLLYPYRKYARKDDLVAVHDPPEVVSHSHVEAGLTLPLLFTTGFCSLALEVVWIRAFTPVMSTLVYSFALLLFVYLLATSIGSNFYRRDLARNKVISTPKLIASLSAASFLPIVLNDPRLDLKRAGVLLSIFPLCYLLGYLTPKLIDRYSLGDPKGAGRAYAINVIGSIVGPLLASYVLLPLVGAKLSMVLLTVPFLVISSLYWIFLPQEKRRVMQLNILSVVLLLCSIFVTSGYEEGPVRKERVVRRDHTATVVSYGEGMGKRLLVNGIGITHLTPITKIMAHLPLAIHKGTPESALVICLGMGTTFRSTLSWNIKSTAVELVPSVKDAFGYYFDDAEIILRNPKGKIVVDDGRRFLQRTEEFFDVITIDPPPPVESAGSSLLYSVDFYELIKSRLKKGGILQQWYPESNTLWKLKTLQAVTRSLTEAFPYVKVYLSYEGWGYHFLASMEPIRSPKVEEFISRLPETARADLLEWNTSTNEDLKSFVKKILDGERDIAQLINEDKSVIITDDSPYNEYFLLRRTLNSWKHTKRSY